MQLISFLLLLLSTLMLVASVVYVVWWHRTYRRVPLVHLLHEDIAHIGISAVVIYPETSAPLVALLEESYARSEAVVVADLQDNRRLESLICQFGLVRVVHSHLFGVRALYRSRKRLYRRVTVVDLPTEHRLQAERVGREVASYDNILYLTGESIVEPNVITYCANVVAQHHLSKGVLLRSAVGAEARFESGGVVNSTNIVRLRSDCPLAWRSDIGGLGLLALLLPLQMVSLATIFHSWPLLVAAVLLVVNVAMFIGESYCVVTEKSLLARLGTRFENLYHFWVERATIRRESRTRDTSLYPSQVQVQSRPARYREGVRQER